jgi:hypothetical protein
MVKRHPFTFIALMTLLGCIAGSAIYFLSPIIPFGSWELAVIPPAKAVKLLSYDYPGLFIRTEDNNVYSCEPLTHWQLEDPSRDRSRNACIQATEPRTKVYRNLFCSEPNQLTPFAPGKVIDTLAIRDCGPDGYVDVHFIALDDGTVWQWQNFQGGNDAELVLLVLAGFGAAIGLVGSTIIWLGMYLWTRLQIRQREML